MFLTHTEHCDQDGVPGLDIYYGLNVKCPLHRLMGSNTWSPAGGTVLGVAELLGGRFWLVELGLWGQALKVLSTS